MSVVERKDQKAEYIFHVEKNFPFCPKAIREKIVRVGFHKYVHQYTDMNIAKCAGATATHYIRHNLTIYDELLRRGIDKDTARTSVRPHISIIFRLWRGLFK